MEKNGNKKKIKNLLFLKKYLKNDILRIFLIIILFALSSLFEALIPFLIQTAVDKDIKIGSYEQLQNTVLLAFIAITLSSIAKYLRIRMLGRMGQNVLYKIRGELFEKIQYLPISFFKKHKTGDLIARISSDLENINNLFTATAQRFFTAVFTIIFIGGAMLFVNIKLTLLAMLPIGIIAILMTVQGKILKKYIKRMLDLNASVSSFTQEILSGFTVFKVFCKEKFIFKRFENLNKEHFRSSLKVSVISAVLSPITNLIVKIIAYGVIIYGFMMVISGETTTGALLSFTVYLVQFFTPIKGIGDVSKSLQAGIASIQRVTEIFETSTGVEENVLRRNGGLRKVIQGNVQFKNVNFGYEKELVLKDVSFNIKSREKVAIVGPTGSGKTTFVNLIARLYDVNSGDILIDGVSVKEWDLKNLRSQIGYLIQDTFLLKDTIYNNLRYGNEKITKAECIEVLKNIGGWDFIEKLPKKLDTEIDKDGHSFSVGQKQLIAIARILLRKPKLMILDEATASIDTRSEKIVQRAIRIATKDVTSIIIAHRLSTIDNADKIILIKENKIFEAGSKDELLKKDGEFAKLWKLMEV